MGRERKIASIGVHVQRGVTTHGLAVNVSNDLEPFSWITPCGLEGVQMTSLQRELGACSPSIAALPGAAGGRALRGIRPPSGRRGPAGGRRVSATRSRAKPGGMDVVRVLGAEVRPLRERKPPWFKVPAPGGEGYRRLGELIRSEGLHTVCQEAACPNVGECWERGTATFMILGDTCTRRCGFCNVKTGRPTWNDPLEPARVARAIARMGLRHAVITSVDRDDLPTRGRAPSWA